MRQACRTTSCPGFTPEIVTVTGSPSTTAAGVTWIAGAACADPPTLVENEASASTMTRAVQGFMAFLPPRSALHRDGHPDRPGQLIGERQHHAIGRIRLAVEGGVQEL